jgi:hypothetical protein
VTAIIRKPVPAAKLPEPLSCKDGECRDLRARRIGSLTEKTPSLDFRCPNLNNGCTTSAFKYPRKVKLEATYPKGYRFHYHQGIDIGGVDGKTQIISVVSGKVRKVGKEPVKGYGGYGRFVEIEGDDGLFYLHAHCAEILVEEGKPVKEQDPIAIVGCTGFETDEEVQPELEHCEALKKWRNEGAQGAPPKPPEVTVVSKTGTPRKMNWMGAHLHFEVSKQPFGPQHALISSKHPETGASIKIKVDRSTDDENREVTEDPLEVLAGLRDWGGTGAPEVLYFPNGDLVTASRIEPMHRAIEHQRLGGYFPIGAHARWHGGVHLFGAQGERFVAPFSGTIIAVRLDEDPERAYQTFGSTNFVLMKHEIPEALVQRLAPRPAEPKRAGERQPSTAAAAQNPKVKVGRGGDNPAAYVIDAKRMLHGLLAADGAPYFSPDDAAALESSAVDEVFFGAIERFQNALNATKPKQTKGEGKGLMRISGPTWNALRAAAPLPAPPVEPPRSSSTASGANGSGDSSQTAQGSSSSAPSENTKAVYSLFLHGEAVALNAACAQRVPWLTRIELEPTEEEKQSAETEREHEGQAERDEAAHTMTGDVGAAGRNVENESEDVSWVQARLKRFGYFSGEVGQAVDPSLLAAIKRFQVKHLNAKKPDGVVSPGGSTYDKLTRTPAELGLNGKKKDAIDPGFLRRARTREGETVKVVSDLRVAIEAGEVLWTTGLGGADNDEGHAPLIHWEIFSAEPLMQTWEQLEDTGDDLSVDVTSPLVSEIEQVTDVDDDEKVLSKNEVATYFSTGLGLHLRSYQCRFKHEAAFTPDAVEAAMSKLGDPFPEGSRAQVEPYLWWNQAAAVLPSSAVVWHYNPVAFVAEYARAKGLFSCTLRINVRRTGHAIPSAFVKLSAPGMPNQELRTNDEGFIILSEVAPGTYKAETGDELANSSELVRASATLAVGGVGEINLELRALGHSARSAAPIRFGA